MSWITITLRKITHVNNAAQKYKENFFWNHFAWESEKNWIFIWVKIIAGLAICEKDISHCYKVLSVSRKIFCFAFLGKLVILRQLNLEKILRMN